MRGSATFGADDQPGIVALAKVGYRGLALLARTRAGRGEQQHFRILERPVAVKAEHCQIDEPHQRPRHARKIRPVRSAWRYLNARFGSALHRHESTLPPARAP